MRLKQIAIFTLVFLIISCNDKNRSNDGKTGFFKKFSFPNNKGENKMDTTIEKTSNNLKVPYCFVNYVSDSFQLITFFSNLKDGFYMDTLNAEHWVSYSTNSTYLYTCSTYSRATGPAKRYILCTDTAHYEVILYPFLALPPGQSHPDSINSLWLDFTSFSGKEKSAKTRNFLMRATDTLNIKAAFFDSLKFNTLFYKKAGQYNHMKQLKKAGKIPNPNGFRFQRDAF